ncbi:unnamed protein product, partial [Rotaria sp. Silwood1]
MEPTLCFSLCQTPIIYIQASICRCSGGGLMDYNRGSDRYCSIPCPKPGNRQVQTINTCGGSEGYSAYVEEHFYTKHAYLFKYQIHFASCQLWKSSGYYDTFQVQIDGSSDKTSLNKMEQCAAACFDQNTTTKSIAFNDDNNQCSCIMPEKLKTDFHERYFSILSNNTCDRYCDSIIGDSKAEHRFKCGSLNNSRIWAVYDLNDACSMHSVYIKELKQCISTEQGFGSSCYSPSIPYVYDGNITWNVFLGIIEKLNLTKSIVSINFDNAVTIDPSWKCSKTTTNINKIQSSLSNTIHFNMNFSTNYLLDKGCLRVVSYLPYSYRLSHSLCIENPMNKNSLLYKPRFSPIYTSTYNNRMTTNCPTNWFDLNGHCYRISDEAKTIQEARNSCINDPIAEQIKNDQEIILNDDDDDDKKEMNNKLNTYMNDLLKGEIAQYTSQWQARLGFYLLDTNVSNTPSILHHIGFFNSYRQPISINGITPSPPIVFSTHIRPLASNISLNFSSINEFQMINSNDNENSTIKDDSCIVFTRFVFNDKRSFILKSVQVNNCSKPRHVLCKTKSRLSFDFQQHCFRKPLTLGVPTIISNRLTYELCVSVCKGLRTTLAVINMNKCYCFDGNLPETHDRKSYYEKYQKKDCGYTCPGNQHEHCGNENTIVVFENPIYILPFTYVNIGKLATSNADFAYYRCIHLDTMNQSTLYEFNLTHENDIHPRHCLELCTNYKQKYALINSNKCLCTNILTKKKEDTLFTPRDRNCIQECSANYFYTCGNSTNSSLYSVYVMKTKCPFGFQISEDEQRCVSVDTLIKKSSFSTAQSYCKSVDGMIAKINNILDIQDVLPMSMLIGNFYGGYQYSSISRISDATKYFWIDRTSDIINNNTTLDHSIGRCSQTSQVIDQNCIVLRYERTIIHDTVMYERCFTESNECSSMSAIPVCVDRHLEFNS